jgi:hypothetical protein
MAIVGSVLIREMAIVGSVLQTLLLTIKLTFKKMMLLLSNFDGIIK